MEENHSAGTLHSDCGEPKIHLLPLLSLLLLCVIKNTPLPLLSLSSLTAAISGSTNRSTMVLKRLIKRVVKDKAQNAEDDFNVEDPTAWMLSNELSQFLILHTFEIKFMCLVGYTFLNGCKVFNYTDANASISYKFVYMALMSTGGGIMVPIFINKIPVTIAYDYYILAILFSFGIHQFFPIVRDVYKLSPVLKTWVVVCYETVRASVVCTMTATAALNIPATMLSFPLFGPIICGCIGGCGGTFLPFSKGLDPIKEEGLASTMFSALVGAASYHVFLHTPLSEGCVDAAKKAQLHITLYFIFVGLINAFHLHVAATNTTSKAAVSETEKKEP